jgi:hypothetical protein
VIVEGPHAWLALLRSMVIDHFRSRYAAPDLFDHVDTAPARELQCRRQNRQQAAFGICSRLETNQPDAPQSGVRLVATLKNCAPLGRPVEPEV